MQQNGPLSVQRENGPEANSGIRAGLPERPGRSQRQHRDFIITFRPKPNVDPVRALRQLLKYAGRHCGMRCLTIEERQP